MSPDSQPTAEQAKGPVFVTGGTGFVGSHLVETLHARGYPEVRCLVRSDPRWLADIPHKRVTGDLSSIDALVEGMAGCSTVFHVAGRTRARDWGELEHANVTGTLNILEAASRLDPAPRVQVVSSLAAIGRSDHPVADESTPFKPVSFYGKSKAVMEERIQPYFHRLSLTVVRPPAVYGPRDTDVFTIFQGAAKGVFAVVGGSNGPALTLVHVRDLVRGMVDAVESASTVGKTYFIGADPAHAWVAVRDAAAAALGRRVVTLRLPSWAIVPVGAVSEGLGRLFGRYPALNREKAVEIRDACIMCTSDRAQNDFGYRSKISLSDGFLETIDWYRTHGWL